MARAPLWPDTRSPGSGFVTSLEAGADASVTEGFMPLDGCLGERLGDGPGDMGTAGVVLLIDLVEARFYLLSVCVVSCVLPYRVLMYACNVLSCGTMNLRRLPSRASPES